MKNLAINVINDDKTVKGQIDLYGDTKIELEYVLSDIREPQSRKISYTKEFVVPGTKNNNTLFMPFFQNGYSVTNFNPNAKLNAQLSNGSTLFEGALQLVKVVENNDAYEYTVIIYSKIVDFFNDLGDDELRGSITLDEWNHTLDIKNIKGSWTQNLILSGNPYKGQIGEGYVYPIDDRATATIDNKLPFFLGRDFRPAIYLKTYVDKIFKTYGWTYKSNFFNSEYFKKLIVPATEENWVGADADVSGPNGVIVGNANAGFTAKASGIKTLYERQPANSKNTAGAGRFTTLWEDLVWGTEDSDPGNVYTNTNGLYTCNKAGFYELTATTRFAGVIGNNSPGGNIFQIRFNGDEQPYVEMELYDAATGTAIPGGSSKTTFSFTLNTDIKGPNEIKYQVAGVSAKIQLSVNQKIKCRYRFVLPEGKKGGGPPPFNNIVWYKTVVGIYFPESNGYATFSKISDVAAQQITNDSFIVTLAKKDLQYGDVVPMSGAIPDKVKLKDLFTSLNNLFNLYWEPTENFKELRIEPYEEFFGLTTGKTPADDWTHKIDRKQDYEIYPMYELTANEYLFTYKEDKDWLNDRYTVKNSAIFGEKKITVANDFIVDQKTISPIFSPTPMYEFEYFSTKETFKRMIMPSYTTRDIDKKTKMSPNIRLLFWGGVLEPLIKWRIGYQTGIVNNKATFYSEVVDGYPYAGHLDNPFSPTEDLNYGVPLEFNFTWNTVTNNNLFNKYWRNWLNSVIDIDAHMLACKVNLTQLDIAGFDLKNFYQVDGVYYRVNKMTYDVDTETADVELLRVFQYPQFTPSVGFYVNGGVETVNPSVPTPTPVAPVPPKPTPTPWTPVFPVTPWDETPAPWITDDVWTPTERPWRGTWVSGVPNRPTVTPVYTGTPWIDPVPVTPYWTVDSADYIPRRNSTNARSFSNNNVAPASDLITLRGFNNAISDELYGPVLINGNDNSINARVSNVSVLGSNNFIASGVENVQVFGDNQRVLQSNATYNHGIVTKNGISIPTIDLLRGGIDTVQVTTGQIKLVTNVRGGSNSIRNYGTQSLEELINGNFE